MTFRLGHLTRAFALFVAVCSTTALAEDQPETRDYKPSLGDVMTIVQLRHAKTWYAASLRNWPLATYELTQMAASLRQAAGLYEPLPEAADWNAAAIDAVAGAIREGNAQGFDAAFRDMTDGCNACHQAAGVGFIKIRPPTRFSPYSNQVFEPQ